MSKQHAAAPVDPARLQKQDPRGWGRRLDAFISARPKTPELPIEAMPRDAIYDRA